MLPAARRVRTAAEFRQTTRLGASVRRGCVVVYLHRTEDPGPARLGVIASSAVGGSVVRHRASRRITGAVGDVLPTLPTGVRIVVRALKGADRETLLPQQLRSAIAELTAKTMTVSQ